jgi:hypothetical protein
LTLATIRHSLVEQRRAFLREKYGTKKEKSQPELFGSTMLSL